MVDWSLQIRMTYTQSKSSLCISETVLFKGLIQQFSKYKYVKVQENIKLYG